MVGSTRRLGSEAGYNLLELLMVVAIMGVLASMAVIQMAASRPGIVGDGAARAIIGQVNQAREMAITQRRFMRIVFSGANTVSIVREDTPLTTTGIGSTMLESGVTYALVTGLPDTPDAFGNSAAVYFGTAVNMKFTPEGILVNENGQIVNGSVFVSLPNQASSARAVTILGSTGRIRLYKWNGKAWVLG